MILSLEQSKQTEIGLQLFQNQYITLPRVNSWDVQIKFMRNACIILTLLLLTGCSSSCTSAAKKEVRVTFVFSNASTNELNGVELECANRFLRVGILVAGANATIFDVRWPAESSGRVNFFDRHTKHLYSIELSLSPIRERVLLGDCRQVTLRILSYEKAELFCE